MNTSFFGELLQTISERGRALLDARDRRGDASARSENLVELCEDLLSGRGEASGVALAREILGHYAELTTGPRIAFFEALAQRFGPDPARIEQAIAAWRDNAVRRDRRRSPRRGRAAPAGAVPPAQSRARRHRGAGAHARAAARRAWTTATTSRAVDADFVHLFSSWFNRGFLVLRRIDWSTPAIDPGKDHPLRGGARDPRLGRSAPPHRSARPALLRLLPSGAGRRAADLRRGRADARDSRRDRADPRRRARAGRAGARRRTAVFYSISNCQRGLAGVSFGNFLIKQVVEEICARNAAALDLRHAVAGAEFRRAGSSASARRRARAALDDGGPRGACRARHAGLVARCRRSREPMQEPLLRAAAWYFLRAQEPPRPAGRCGRALPSRQRRAARALNWLGDSRSAALAQSLRADGELSLRSRRHREEPRGLCGEPHGGGLQRGAPPAARRPRNLRAGAVLGPVPCCGCASFIRAAPERAMHRRPRSDDGYRARPDRCRGKPRLRHTNATRSSRRRARPTRSAARIFNDFKWSADHARTAAR